MQKVLVFPDIRSEAAKNLFIHFSLESEPPSSSSCCRAICFQSSTGPVDYGTHLFMKDSEIPLCSQWRALSTHTRLSMFKMIFDLEKLTLNEQVNSSLQSPLLHRPTHLV